MIRKLWKNQHFLSAVKSIYRCFLFEMLTVWLKLCKKMKFCFFFDVTLVLKKGGVCVLVCVFHHAKFKEMWKLVIFCQEFSMTTKIFNILTPWPFLEQGIKNEQLCHKSTILVAQCQTSNCQVLNAIFVCLFHRLKSSSSCPLQLLNGIPPSRLMTLDSL